jgi:hypothetical protein
VSSVRERAKVSSKTSGDQRRENANAYSVVIASAAKQSIVPHEERMDCFAALAMTEDPNKNGGE